MAKGGPIIILEDDKEDQELLLQALQSLQVTNIIRFFDNGSEALQYLSTTTEQPFLIISNVRLNRVDGFEVRERIQQDESLRKKGIPFIFLSTDARKEVVEKAYELTVQGFYEKQNTIPGLEQDLKMILGYWERSKHPNSPFR